jgi:hypothetical protein
MKLSNKIIDQILLDTNRYLKRIDDYVSARLSIYWLCLVCQYRWKTTSDKILNSHRKCPNCSCRARLTNEIIDSRITNRNIRRISSFINSTIPIEWECLICKYIWSATTGNVLDGVNPTGCSQCSNRIKLTDEIIDKRLIENNRPIIRLGHYDHSIEKRISWQCLNNNCNNIWITTPSEILNNNSGCPICKLHRNQKIMINLLHQFDDDFISEFKLSNIITSARLCKFDAYSRKYNLVIEYDGEQHFRPVRFGGISQEEANINYILQQERDIYKNNFCKEHKINIIRIDGRKYRNKKLVNYMNEILLTLKKI